MSDMRDIGRIAKVGAACGAAIAMLVQAIVTALLYWKGLHDGFGGGGLYPGKEIVDYLDGYLFPLALYHRDHPYLLLVEIVGTGIGGAAFATWYKRKSKTK